jgi:hypothetical protein
MEKSPIEKLNSRELPGLVRWYEPRLLMRVGMRTIISSVFGQYADQRLIQAATDVAPVDVIINRYNYADTRSDDPDRRVAMGENGAFWIDYIADIGDGFDQTYTTAYLLAQPQLEVEGTDEPLTAGSILIMGGDQCYPQATREEYKLRLQTPYDWAYNVPQAERKLFAIPGNHDWYDGLSAFDSLFCSARDRMSQQNGNKIGGWQCKQHRSYWAIELPYRWWIWGCDIQFSQYLDISQVNYFEAIASLMGPGDNLIICIAQPTWMIAEEQGFDEDSNFFKITSIARRRGIKISAVIAGDWHHYNRYYAPGIDVHLFTSGGGGSFLHPTHTLRNEISITWPNPQVAGSADLETKFQTEGAVTAERHDLRLKNNTPPPADSSQDAPVRPLAAPTRRDTRRRRAKERRAKVYPSKTTSFLLSLKGLLFPFTNYFFGIGIGFIYWMVTWQFYSVAGQHNISNGQIDAVTPETYWGLVAYMPLYLLQGLLVSIALVAMLGGLWFLLCWYVDSAARPRWKHYLVKLVVGTAHFAAHVFAMFALGLALVLFHNEITPTIKHQIDKVWQDRERQPEIVRDVITETLEPITRRAIEQRQIIEREDIARRMGRPMVYPRDRALPPLEPITQGAEPSEEGGGLPYKEIRQLIGFVLYPIEMILIGGFIGAFLWGLYWVLAGCLMRMHTEDAFAALRIGDYRNFLRMKFEPDRVTIYPIALDKTPKRSFWKAPRPDVAPPPHNPQLVAKGPLALKLIEEPIVIHAVSEDRP